MIAYLLIYRKISVYIFFIYPKYLIESKLLLKKKNVVKSIPNGYKECGKEKNCVNYGYIYISSRLLRHTFKFKDKYIIFK